MSKARQAFDTLAATALHRRVTRTRMFMTTRQVYLEADDPALYELQLWFEPTWSLWTPAGTVTSSDAIDWPSSWDDEAEMSRASATLTAASTASKVLIRCDVRSLHLDPAALGLTVQCGPDHTVATIVEPDDIDRFWVIHDPNRELAVRGTPRGLRLGTRPGAFK